MSYMSRISFLCIRYSFLVISLVCVVSSFSSSASADSCTGTRWIVAVGSLEHSQQAFPLAQQQQYFDSPCTFLIVGAKPGKDYRGWSVVLTRSVKQVADVEAAAGESGIGAVLYDPESWGMTPQNEQTDPVSAACQAAQIAHAHGKFLIAAPATDLINIISPGSKSRYTAFENTRIAEGMGKCVDAYEIQAQGSEADMEKFREYVHTEAQQARSSNPHILVLAGISTNPSGKQVTAQQLYNAVQSVRTEVNGFWLNIPSGGKYCPKCGEAQPQLAAQLMPMIQGR